MTGDSTCSKHISERLSKLEQVFERFVCRKNSVAVQPGNTPSSPTLVDSSDKESNLGLPKIPSDAQSTSSMGDGIVSRIRKLLLGVDAHYVSLEHKRGHQRRLSAPCPVMETLDWCPTVTLCSGLWSICYHHSTMPTLFSNLRMGG